MRTTPKQCTRPPQTGLFATLPQELKDHIISYITRTTHLSALSLTCLSLRASTLPFLFSSITIRWVPQTFLRPPVLHSPSSEYLLRTLTISPNYSSLIHNLVFCDVPITSDVPQTILASTTNLTRLELEYMLYCNTTRHDEFNATALASMLRLVRSTLKTLRISYQLEIDDIINWPYSSVVGDADLRSFTVLEDLEAPLAVLLGWYPGLEVHLKNVLPRGLKKCLIVAHEQQHYGFLSWDERALDRLLKRFEQERELEGFSGELRVQTATRWLESGS